MLANRRQELLPSQGVVPDTGRADVPDTGRAVVPDTERAVVPDTGRAVVPDIGRVVVPDIGRAVVLDKQLVERLVGQSRRQDVGRHPTVPRSQPPALFAAGTTCT